MANLISLEKINLNFADKKILDNIDINIKKDDFITIIGPNGSGKSSLIKIIIGSLKASSGKVRRNKNLKIAYVPQKMEINQTIPINAEYFLQLNQKIEPKLFDKIITELKIGNFLQTQLNNLSGGQKQKILLAKALLSKPNLLILDEPAQNLDISGQLEFYNYIDKLHKEQNISILMVSHDLHIVMSSTKKVICLHHHICCQGEPKIIAQNPDFKEIFGNDMNKLISIYNHYHDHHHG
ncbi:ATP-binding cassette domain-containing protein [Rickettsiales bacterium]|nr:ATP-binding cassette domain-containing protein [Rickettsiales bacterium]